MSVCRQRGFSLLEMLVTLFVIVIITSLVTVNTGSGGGEIILEAKLRKLMDDASYALDEAQLIGDNYGLLIEQVEQDGDPVYHYSWRELRPEGWRAPLSGKEIFVGDSFPPDIELALELEGVPVESLEDAAESDTVPQLIFYASGETTEGAIDVRRRGDGELLWRLEWDLLGRFEMLRRGIAEDEEAL